MHFKKITFLTLLISSSAFTRVEKITEEDVLYKVSIKLNQIEAQLKNQRVDLTQVKFSWPEFENFQKHLMFVVAHDPGTQKLEDIPAELSPSHLTLGLREAWTKLEDSVFSMEGTDKEEVWLTLKTDMEQFLKLREELLYQPARNMIKSGLLSSKLHALKVHVSQKMVDTKGQKHLSVRLIDPVIEGLTAEMTKLNFSVKQLKEFREPPKVEKKTIYHKDLTQELGIFAVAAAFAGILLTFLGIGLFKLFRKKAPKPEEETNAVDGFDYSEWLKSFEANLRAFKNVEDKIVEDHLEMKHFSDEMRDARKKLNQSDSQQEFYQSLDLLNNSSPKIEDYFEKVNLKKGTEASRKMVHAIVQLCQAIEAGKSINVTGEKKYKVIKNEQPSGSKAA